MSSSPAPVSHQQLVVLRHTQSSLLASTSSSISPSPLLESDQSDHSLSLLAMSPPSEVHGSFPPQFYGDLIPGIDRKAADSMGHTQVYMVCVFINITCIPELTLGIHPPSLSIYLIHTGMVKAAGDNPVLKTCQAGCVGHSTINLSTQLSNRFA